MNGFKENHQIIINQLFLAENLIEEESKINTLEEESPLIEDLEKEKLNHQMKLMEKEIEKFKNRQKEEKSNTNSGKNIEDLKQKFSTLNQRSDAFLDQMDLMKRQIGLFSDDFEELQRKKETLSNKNRENSLTTKSELQGLEINAKIQFSIDNILQFQKEMLENNAILTEYVLYFDGIERKLEEYEKSDENNQNFPEKVTVVLEKNLSLAKESLLSRINEIYLKYDNERAIFDQNHENKTKLSSLLIYLKEKMLLKKKKLQELNEISKQQNKKTFKY